MTDHNWLFSTKEELPEPITDFELSFSPAPCVKFFTQSRKRVGVFVNSPKQVTLYLKELAEMVRDGAEAKVQTKAILSLNLEACELMKKENLKDLRYLEFLLENETKNPNPSKIFIEKLEATIAEFKEWCALNNVEYPEPETSPETNLPENEDMATKEPEDLQEQLLDAYACSGIEVRRAFRKLIETYHETGKSVKKGRWLDSDETPAKYFRGKGKSEYRRILGSVIKRDETVKFKRNASYYPDFPEGFDLDLFISKIKKLP